MSPRYSATSSCRRGPRWSAVHEGGLVSSFVGDEPGNLEKRRADRIAVNFSVSFREIDDAEAERMNEQMGGLDALPVPVPAAPAGSHSDAPDQQKAARTENLSQGGLSL